MDWTGLATFIAAAAAAVLSAASLLMSGRREDRRWKREMLEETMVSLFDASFRYVDRAAFEAAEAGKDLSEYKEHALERRYPSGRGPGMRRGLVLRVKKRPAGRHGAAMGVREVCGSWTGAAFGGLSSAELRRHALALCPPRQLDWCSG
jgi:hypothetical protein